MRTSIPFRQCRNFYPRSPCGERLSNPLFNALGGNNFYPRSPCGERHGFLHGLPKEHLFLSTLSLRRATTGVLIIRQQCRDFYPRSPCGERLSNPLFNALGGNNFYPRSPCGERHGFLHGLPKEHLFLSTLSLRRATTGVLIIRQQCRDFYPRSPCGERRFSA